MQIEHVATWCQDLEQMRQFYEEYFGGRANQKYVNARGFNSYFLHFEQGARLELMQWPQVNQAKNSASSEYLGLGHLAFSLGSREAVDRLTTRLVQDGFERLSGPRVTGDGYYESCLLDHELNRIELCA